MATLRVRPHRGKPSDHEKWLELYWIDGAERRFGGSLALRKYHGDDL